MHSRAAAGSDAAQIARATMGRRAPSDVALRRLLIVSPHFPPADAVDMHRVRMNVRHYREHGWDPLVLTVDPAATGRLVDPALLETLPSNIEVHRCGALPLALARRLGVSDIALRSYMHMRSAGDALIASRRPDLVLFSTTAFLTMALGPRWRRRYGVPFVLDMHDPWHAAPGGGARFERKGMKHALMRQAHRAAEARTAPAASGFISVSEAYIEALREHYPSLRNVPAATAPFGYADTDADAAARFGHAWTYAPHAEALKCVSAGRIAPPMLSSLDAFVSILAAARTLGIAPLANMCAGFLGTGYQASGNPVVSAAVAARFSVADRVFERPDRVPLLDALKTLLEADVLLILGSEDAAYQPSKLYQYLSLGKPLLCVAPGASALARIVREMDTVVFVPTETTDAIGAARGAAAKLARLLADKDGSAYAERKDLLERFNARALAARECALFERALAYSREAA
ncbi:MAG: glycosyltransferase [Vitreimonas sp.]